MPSSALPPLGTKAAASTRDPRVEASSTEKLDAISRPQGSGIRQDTHKAQGLKNLDPHPQVTCRTDHDSFQTSGSPGAPSRQLSASPARASSLKPSSWTKSWSSAVHASAQFLGLKTQEQRRIWSHLQHLMDEAELSQRIGSTHVALVLYESIEQACRTHQLSACELMFGEGADFRPGSPLDLALEGKDNGPLVLGLMSMASRYVNLDSPLTLWSLFAEEDSMQSYASHLAIENKREAWLKRHGVAARCAIERGRDSEASQRLSEMQQVDSLRIHRRHYLRERVRTHPVKHVGLGLKPWHLAERHGCQNTLLILGTFDRDNHQRFIMREAGARPMPTPMYRGVRWNGP